MYGLIVKLTTIPGKREELMSLLKESTADMPGCFSYVVAEDAHDEDTLWVTEVWDSVTSHDNSLTLPAVRNVIPRAKAIVAALDRVAVTNPAWGVGLANAKQQ
jgi:quinol monooxygenase YgiN